nr:retrovirus-related Pol polyprotein from transposon TNT 1-94 [Tanacetum cinerariifolium]
QFHAPTTQDMEILIQTCLMPLTIKTQNDSFRFVHELKQEMHVDLKYVESLEKEVDKLESDKAEFLNMYDVILQECVSKDVMCSYLMSLSDLDALDELQCLYLHKLKECDCLAQKLSKQTENTMSVPKANVSEGVSKPVIARTLPQTAGQAVSNTNVLNPGMYRIDSRSTQTRAPQLPQTVRNTNPRVPTSSGVNHKPNVSRPQHKSNQSRDMVLPNNSSKVDSNQFACVTKMFNDVNARTKNPNVVPISTRKPKSHANKSVATPHKKKVASKSTKQKPQNYFRMMYENTSKAWKWWIEQQSPSRYNWIIQLILFIVDSGCTKHMTGNLKLLCNFVEKFLGTVHFGNDQFTPILSYGDFVQENVTINRVYYVEGLNQNLFSVGQFCDADLEVTFKKSTCFVRDLQGNDLLTGNRRSDLYTISLQESTSSTPLCLMAKASPTQAWLWHRRLSHLNFDYINLLSKKDIVIGLPKLKYVKDQLCLVPQQKKALDYENSDPVPQIQNVLPSADTTVPSQQ